LLYRSIITAFLAALNSLLCPEPALDLLDRGCCSETDCRCTVKL
jgi:hypothetical protein